MFLINLMDLQTFRRRHQYLYKYINHDLKIVYVTFANRRWVYVYLTTTVVY